MSAFDTIATAGVTTLFAHFGTAATYSPNGWIPTGTTSIPITVTVVLDQEPIDNGGAYGTSTEEAPVVYVKDSEIATPRRGDTITISGTDYTVEQVAEPQEYVHRLICSC